MNGFSSELVTKMADDIESTFGIYGILVLIVFQAIQIIIAFVPGGLVEVVGGMIYGTLTGLFISSTGIFLGSLTAFYIAKRYGKKLVVRFTGEEKLEKYERLFKHQRLKGFVYLFFFLPGVPKDVLIYVVGIVSDFKVALTASALRIPSIIVTVFAGSLVGDGNIKIGAIVYFSFIAIGLVGVYIHNRILGDKEDKS